MHRGATTGRRFVAPPGRAELAAARLFAVGGTVLALIAIGLGLVLSRFRQEPITLDGPLPWFFADLIFIAAVGAMAPRLGLTALRMLSGVGAAGFVVVVSGVAAQALHAPTDSSLVPWAAATFGAPLVAALVAVGLPGAWLVATVSLVGAQLVRELSGLRSAGFWANDAQSLMTGLTLGFIGAIVLDISRRLDAAAAERSLAAESASRERGRLTARARAAALVHDEVLAALNLAASPLPLPPERVAAQASRARTLLAGLASGDESGEAAQFVQRIADDTRELCPEARFTTTRADGWEALQLTAQAAAALRAAARQALANSARHAGDGAARAVAIHWGAASVTVRVSDDGAGFDPKGVPQSRLGTRVSIVQRMRDAGGLARVASSPGAGTEVLLGWPCNAQAGEWIAAAAPSHPVTAPTHAEAAGRAGAGFEGRFAGQADAQVRDSAAGTRSYVEDDDGVAPSPRLLRLGLPVIAVAFCATQLVAAWAAAAAARTTASPDALGSTAQWMPFVVLATVFVGSEVLRRGRDPRPNDRRVAALIGVLTTATAVGAATAPFTFADMWFAVSGALIYAALAFRGRAGAALAGGGALLAVIVAAGLVQGAAPLTIVMVAARPVIIVGLSAALAFAVESMQRRAAMLHARALRDAEQLAWWAGRRAELASRGAQVHSLVDPTLAQLASGAQATPQLQRQCLALEGQLRDDIRAGRLAAEPLAAAAARARARGVDVVLLDDRDGPIEEAHAGDLNVDLGTLLARMAAALDLAEQHAVGRVLPVGRSRAVSLTIDGRPIDLVAATPQNH